MKRKLLQNEKCVACGNIADGTYENIPVCLTCYQNGNLLRYLKKVKEEICQQEKMQYL